MNLLSLLPFLRIAVEYNAHTLILRLKFIQYLYMDSNLDVDGQRISLAQDLGHILCRIGFSTLIDASHLLTFASTRFHCSCTLYRWKCWLHNASNANVCLSLGQ